MVDLLWRPLLAVALMAATMLGLLTVFEGSGGVWLALLPGWGVYVGVLALVGGFRGEEMAVVRRALGWG